MSDWDHDGDEDYFDGILEAIFWIGPPWAVLLVIAFSLICWAMASNA